MPRALRSSGPPYPTLHTTHPSLESIITSSRIVALAESPPKKILIKQHRKGKLLELVCSEGKRCKSRLRKEDLQAQQQTVASSGGEEGEEKCAFRLKAEPYVPYEPLLGLESDHKFIITVFVPHSTSVHDLIPPVIASKAPPTTLNRKRSRSNLTTPAPNRATSTSSELPPLLSHTNYSSSISASVPFDVPLLTGRKAPLKRASHPTPEEAYEYSKWNHELGLLSSHPQAVSYQRGKVIKPWKNWGWVDFDELRERGEDLRFGGNGGGGGTSGKGRISGEPFSGIPFRSILDETSTSFTRNVSGEVEVELEETQLEMGIQTDEEDLELEREATLGLLALWGQAGGSSMMKTSKENHRKEEKRRESLGIIEETPEYASVDLDEVDKERDGGRGRVEEEEQTPIPQDTSTTPIEPTLPLLLPEKEFTATTEFVKTIDIDTDTPPTNALGLINLNSSTSHLQNLEHSAPLTPSSSSSSSPTLSPALHDIANEDEIDLPTKPQSESEFESDQTLGTKTEFEMVRSVTNSLGMDGKRKRLSYDDEYGDGDRYDEGTLRRRDGDNRVKQEIFDEDNGMGMGSKLLEDRAKAKRLRKMLFSGGEEKWNSTYSLKSLEYNLAALETLSPPIKFTINFSLISLLTHRPHIYALPRLSHSHSSSSSSQIQPKIYSLPSNFSSHTKKVLRDLYGFELTSKELSVLEENANEEFWEYVEGLERIMEINGVVRDKLEYRDRDGERERERERKRGGKRRRR